ncbi:hypothetical protein TIFTF001_033827 [Ficus carica]|uniref:Uncharacterized protein n=1 Tax=Ficus carica TaxID=3494 RepID=A0AA88J7N7_FICCA|nr:hypothetical protein TIFTF001_033827 [Ficus carica]
MPLIGQLDLSTGRPDYCISKTVIRRKLPSFFLHRQRSDKKMLMPLTQIQDGKGLIDVITPLPNARSLFFLTSLAAISEDGTCFSLSFYSYYSFNFFPIDACLASKPYLPFAASTKILVELEAGMVCSAIFWSIENPIRSIGQTRNRTGHSILVRLTGLAEQLTEQRQRAYRGLVSI